VGYSTACSILVDDRLFCWGENGYYQAGFADFSTAARTTAEEVSQAGIEGGGTDALWKISIGRFHACGVTR